MVLAWYGAISVVYTYLPPHQIPLLEIRIGNPGYQDLSIAAIGIRITVYYLIPHTAALSDMVLTENATSIAESS